MKSLFIRSMLAISLLIIILIIILHISLQPKKKPMYVTAPVGLGNIENVVLATGRLDAIERVNVGAQVSGQVKSLTIKLGDHVSKGQLIAEIDDLPQRNDLRAAETALSGITAELKSKQALLKQAESNYRRQRRMLDEEASSIEDYESSEASLAIAHADLISQKARLMQAQIEVDKKKVDLSYTRVLAPMDGIVIAIVTQQGQTLNANQSTPTIAILARLDVMTIKAQISEADINHVYIGQKAHFTVFSDPERIYTTTLRSVELAPESMVKEESYSERSPNSNAAVYYNALLDVPNPENRLRIAMTTQISLVLEHAENIPLIPIQAVNNIDGKKHYVQVLTSDSQLETREITIGISNNVDVQVINGIKVGEKVVLAQSEDIKAKGDGVI